MPYPLSAFGEVLKPADDDLGDLTPGKVVTLPDKLRTRLFTVGGGKHNDPSREDSSCIVSILRLGHRPSDVYATFTASARGADAQERKNGHFDDYVQRTIRNAVAYLGNAKGQTMAEPTQERLIDVEWDEFQKSLQPVYDQWQIESGKESVAGVEEEPEWVIEGILTADGGLLCSGLPKATKSLIWLCAALECVTSRVVWGKFRVPETVRNVVFVETEDSRSMVKRRLRALCRGRNISYPPDGFHLVRPGPFALVEEGQEKLREIINKTHADLLILSTLQGLISGRDWNKQEDMAPVNAVFVGLQAECAIVSITHSPWSEKRAAGSVTQAANFAALMHVEKTVENGETITAVKLDSKETSQDTRFDLQLDIRPRDYGDGRVTTQVWGVEYVEKSKGGRPNEAASFRERALQLRTEGKSMSEIGQMLKLSKTSVHRLVKGDE